MKAKLPVVLALWLSGCASPDPTYYTLQAVPGHVLSSQAVSIEVRRPGLAGYLDRSDIVLKSASYQLSVNGQLRWGEPLGDMIGRVLAQDLTQRLPGASVFAEGGAISASAQRRVEVDVETFDPDASGAVVLNAQVAVTAGATHEQSFAQHLLLTAEPAGPGAAQVVASMSRLLGQLADRLATALAGAPPSVISLR